MKSKIFPHNLLQTIVLIVVSAVLASPFVFFEKQLIPLIGSEVFSLVYFGLLFSIMICITINFNKRNKLTTQIHFGLIKPKMLLSAVLIIFLFHLGLNTVVSGALTSFLNLKSMPGPTFSLSFLLGALLFAPILEEVVFRGIILEGFLSNYNAKKSIIISVVIFALFHWNAIQSTHAIFVGSFISYIYVRERSLIMPILIHFSNNLIGVVFTYWKSKHHELPMSELYGAFTIIIYVIAIILFFATLLLFFKKYYPKSISTTFNKI